MKAKYLIKDIVRVIFGWLWFIPLGYIILHMKLFDVVVVGFIISLYYIPVYVMFEILWHKLKR